MHVYRNRGKPEKEIPRPSISGFGIGNTAENTVGAIKCSLLALKPNGFVPSVRAY